MLLIFVLLWSLTFCSADADLCQFSTDVLQIKYPDKVVKTEVFKIICVIPDADGVITKCSMSKDSKEFSIIYDRDMAEIQLESDSSLSSRFLTRSEDGHLGHVGQGESFLVDPKKCSLMFTDFSIEDDGFWTISLGISKSEFDLDNHTEQILVIPRWCKDSILTYNGSSSTDCNFGYKLGRGFGVSQKLTNNSSNAQDQLKTCREFCKTTPNCRFFSLSNGHCYLKSNSTIYACKEKGAVFGSSNCILDDDNIENGNEEVIAITLATFLILALLGICLFLAIWSLRSKISGGGENKKSVKAKTESFYSTTTALHIVDCGSERWTVRLSELPKLVQNGQVPGQDEFLLLEHIDTRDHVLKFSKDFAKTWNIFNRFGHVVPYDKNRVKLKEAIRKCDYVNASFVADNKTGSEENMIIVTQDPSLKTMPHFLQMCLEQKVDCIVTLSQGNLAKSSNDYWPQNGQETKDLTEIWRSKLSLELPFSISDVIKRKLEFTSEQKPVVSLWQYHMTNWTESGLPKTSESLIKLCHEILELKPSQLLVHCSSGGGGMSGVFLAILMILSKITNDKLDSINIFDIVLDLRKSRRHLVQSKAQYEFLYQTIGSHLSKESYVEMK